MASEHIGIIHNYNSLINHVRMRSDSTLFTVSVAISMKPTHTFYTGAVITDNVVADHT